MAGENPILDLGDLDLELPTAGDSDRKIREDTETIITEDLDDPNKKKEEAPDDKSKEQKADEGKKEEKLPSEEEKGKKEAEGTGEDGKIDEDVPTLIGTIKDRFGYDFGDKEFEDSEEGLVELAIEAANKRFEQEVEQFSKENPDAHKFFEYLKAGGNPADYIKVMAPEINYLSVTEVKDEDVALQERLVRDSLLSVGEDEAAISEAISEYKASGVLKSEARRALGRLQRDQKEEQDSIVQTQKEHRESIVKKNQEYFEARRAEVEKAKDILGFPITEKDKVPFFEFIKPDEEGRTAYAKNIESLTPQQVLAIQYLVFKKFDFASIIDTKAKTKHAESLTERLKNGGGNRKVNGGASSTERKTTTVDVDSLDLSLS